MGDWTSSWATASLERLFRLIKNADFKLFFSIDTYATSDSTQWIQGIKNYTDDISYYEHNNLPFVSIFSGGTLNQGSSSPNQWWKDEVIDKLGQDVYFMPNFDNAKDYGDNFFGDFPVANGVFGWESAWPEIQNGVVNVTSNIDQEMKDAAHANGRGKTYMMALSTFQYKHMPGTNNDVWNWMRIGEANLPMKMQQILEVNPDMVEILTWNDAGEGH